MKDGIHNPLFDTMSEWYDLFCHSQDRAYDVGEVLQFVREAGLTFKAWSHPMLYDPNSWLNNERTGDPLVNRKVQKKTKHDTETKVRDDAQTLPAVDGAVLHRLLAGADMETRWKLAEAIAGTGHTMHMFWVTKPRHRKPQTFSEQQARPPRQRRRGTVDESGSWIPPSSDTDAFANLVLCSPELYDFQNEDLRLDPAFNPLHAQFPAGIDWTLETHPMVTGWRKHPYARHCPIHRDILKKPMHKTQTPCFAMRVVLECDCRRTLREAWEHVVRVDDVASAGGPPGWWEWPAVAPLLLESAVDLVALGLAVPLPPATNVMSDQIGDANGERGGESGSSDGHGGDDVTDDYDDYDYEYFEGGGTTPCEDRRSTTCNGGNAPAATTNISAVSPSTDNDDRPYVRKHPDLLTPEEARFLRNAVSGQLRTSPHKFGIFTASQRPPFRTSRAGYLTPRQEASPIGRRIMQKLARAAGIASGGAGSRVLSDSAGNTTASATATPSLPFFPASFGEILQVQRYETGGRYACHWDPIWSPAKRRMLSRSELKGVDKGGRRMRTLIVYLHTTPSGGETVFPHFNDPRSTVPEEGGGKAFEGIDANATCRHSGRRGGGQREGRIGKKDAKLAIEKSTGRGSVESISPVLGDAVVFDSWRNHGTGTFEERGEDVDNENETGLPR
jgi:hypothetical protein